MESTQASVSPLTEPIAVHKGANGGSSAASPPEYIYNDTQLKPVLPERHVNMMAFSQCVGIGLFLQTGRIIFLAGPGLGWVSYIISGTVLWSSAACLGEMTALFPVKGPLIEFPRRFLRPSLGYTSGWITWFSWVVIVALELVAITHMFEFRYDTANLTDQELDGYPPRADLENQYHALIGKSATITIRIGVLALMFVINLLPVRHFGQLEYLFGIVKMLFIIAMILFNIIIYGQRVQRLKPQYHEMFWTYTNETLGFQKTEYLLRDPDPEGHPRTITGSKATFLGMWDAMTTSLFGLIGFETIAITAAENRDLQQEETVKIATRKISLRIITLYTLVNLSVGLNVPSNDPFIRVTEMLSINHGSTSALVLSPIRNGVSVLPKVVNYFIVFTAATAGANAVYNGSRTLHALACIEDAWPTWWPVEWLRRKLARTGQSKVPRPAIMLTAAFGLLAFIARGPNSEKVLAGLVRCAVVGMLITYGLVAASFIQFRKRLQKAVDGDDHEASVRDIRELLNRDSPKYPYRSHGQPIRAYYAVVACSLFALFNGWRVFVEEDFDAQDFVGCYIGIFLMIALVLMYEAKAHIAISGWQSIEWRRNRPLPFPAGQNMPMVAEGYPRRGRLYLKDPTNWVEKGNARSLAEWIWVWLK